MRQKGLDSLRPAMAGKEVFVHSSGLIDQVREGDTVSYEVEEGRKGPNAYKVKKGNQPRCLAALKQGNYS